jgi:hypothetical protein
MIIKISEIQIFTEIEISIFEKVVHFLKNRIKKLEHPNFFWHDETCLIKDKKKIKTSQTQTVGVKMSLSVVDLIWNQTYTFFFACPQYKCQFFKNAISHLPVNSNFDTNST